MLEGKKIRIFRITHYQNLPFILKNGIVCASSPIQDPNFVKIGFQSLIDVRAITEVKASPGGVLNDYVPFYFCPKSPMLYVLFKKRVPDFFGSQEDLIYLVSSVETIVKQSLQFVFSDRHAKLIYANFYNQHKDLGLLDWTAIQSEKWGDQYDPTRTVREFKQAEFLVHSQVPIHCIEGIICPNEKTFTFVQGFLSVAPSLLQAVVRPNYFF